MVNEKERVEQQLRLGLYHIVGLSLKDGLQATFWKKFSEEFQVDLSFALDLGIWPVASFTD